MITLNKVTREKAPKRPKTELQKLSAKAKREKWEIKFLLLWRACGGPNLIREHKFTMTRKWRFDFSHLLSRTAIEIEGGTWSGGRHTRGAGYKADCEKYNFATMAGWRVFRLTSDMITLDNIHMIQQAIADEGKVKP